MASSISSRRDRGGAVARRRGPGGALLVGAILFLCAGLLCLRGAHGESPATPSGVSPVSAPPSDPKSESVREAARARLVEGVTLLRAGQYAPALAKFDQAYALVPSPNIYFDRGLAYVGLGHDADALEAFEAFLARADHAPPGTRDKATHERDRLRGRVATLVLTSEPLGAEISIDGRSRGATPLSGSLYLDPGPHEIAARNPATGAAATERVVASPQQALTLTLRLGAPASRPSVSSASPAPAPSSVPAAGAGSTPTVAARAVSDTPEPHARRLPNAWAISAGALGVALLGAGVTFGILAQRQSDSVARDSSNYAVFVKQKETDGTRDQTLQEVFLVTGGVAVATGIVLYAIQRRGEGERVGREQESRASAVRRPAVTLSGGPSLAPGLLGARLRLIF